MYAYGKWAVHDFVLIFPIDVLTAYRFTLLQCLY